MSEKREYGETVRKIFSISEGSTTHEEIKERLLDGGKVTGTNMCVMICAILIASVGLNTGSTAVIIGAMLISPLMGSILAFAYGEASLDRKVAFKHIIGFVFQIFASVLTATLYFLISPIKEPTAELLARTSPTLFDVIIATAGGVAGIIGQTRKDKANNIIPGVAIATALMPPLCTCGYSIANGNWSMLGGAAYLFIINTYFIFLSACIVLMILKIPKVRVLTEREWKKKQIRMLINTIIASLPATVGAVWYIVSIVSAD